MTYDEWQLSLPAAVTTDVIFRVQAFRLASFLADCAERDTRAVARDPRFAKNAIQLIRSAGSVSASIAEGYPRRSPRDRIRYYEYALGSTAEAKSWYLSARTFLPPATLEDRFALLTSITRLLRTMIRSATPLPDPASRHSPP
jgi:four helix bundle protein